jgi:hypothetical protein
MEVSVFPQAINSTEQVSWEANSRAATQKFQTFYRTFVAAFTRDLFFFRPLLRSQAGEALLFGSPRAYSVYPELPFISGSCLLHPQLLYEIAKFPVIKHLKEDRICGQRSRYSDWLRARRPRSRSSSPGTVKNFLLFTSSRPALGPSSLLSNG